MKERGTDGSKRDEPSSVAGRDEKDSILGNDTEAETEA